MRIQPWTIRIELLVVAMTFLTALTGCNMGQAGLEVEVREVILRGEAWWNDGSIEGFMESYWNSPDLCFVSGSKVTYGWKETLDGYLKRYPDRKTMGRLVFSDLDITILSDKSALALGAWRVERESDQVQGLFTLVLRRFDEGWRIVHDHTSSEDAVEN